MPRYLNVTDEQTDGRLTIAIPRYVHIASRGKNRSIFDEDTTETWWRIFDSRCTFDIASQRRPVCCVTIRYTICKYIHIIIHRKVWKAASKIKNANLFHFTFAQKLTGSPLVYCTKPKPKITRKSYTASVARCKVSAYAPSCRRCVATYWKDQTRR